MSTRVIYKMLGKDIVSACRKYMISFNVINKTQLTEQYN